jgi:hypothetical protein
MKMNRLATKEKGGTNSMKGVDLMKMTRLATKETLLVIAGMVLLAVAVLPNAAMAQSQHDHALLNPAGGDTAVICGVLPKVSSNAAVRGGGFELNVSASAGSSAATLTLTFLDGDGISFKIPANSSFHITHAFGATKEQGSNTSFVDTAVKVTLTSGVALVSAVANKGSKDPFTETVAKKENFCVTTPGDDGSTSAEALF